MWDGKTEQIISFANILPEDFVKPDEAAELVGYANDELISMIRENQDMYPYGVGLIPMNNIPAALDMLRGFDASDEIVGVQLFTRALGESIAASRFKEIFNVCHQLGLPIWLHPVFDMRKPDNNIVFSWEYELSQAMLQIVNARYFEEFPELKMIVHHAGGLIPFFYERINHILPPDQAQDFKKFYVDTALLGNPKAINLTIEYFGISHVMYGTDAPFGIAPAGAVREISDAIEYLELSETEKSDIFSNNILSILE